MLWWTRILKLYNVNSFTVYLEEDCLLFPILNLRDGVCVPRNRLLSFLYVVIPTSCTFLAMQCFSNLLDSRHRDIFKKKYMVKSFTSLADNWSTMLLSQQIRNKSQRINQ